MEGLEESFQLGQLAISAPDILSNHIAWRDDWRFYGLPIIQKHRKSTMRFGAGLRLRSSTRSNPLGVNHPVTLSTWQAGAELEIGENFGMTGGVICTAEHIIMRAFGNSGRAPILSAISPGSRVTSG